MHHTHIQLTQFKPPNAERPKNGAIQVLEQQSVTQCVTDCELKIILENKGKYEDDNEVMMRRQPREERERVSELYPRPNGAKKKTVMMMKAAKLEGPEEVKDMGYSGDYWNDPELDEKKLFLRDCQIKTHPCNIAILVRSKDDHRKLKRQEKEQEDNYAYIEEEYEGEGADAEEAHCKDKDFIMDVVQSIQYDCS
ncbi:hypothetical protein Q8A73_009600 [Channa argus]|nr:hypothetical protein Q8A73_009600 [Channa argus]